MPQQPTPNVVPQIGSAHTVLHRLRCCKTTSLTARQFPQRLWVKAQATSAQHSLGRRRLFAGGNLDQPVWVISADELAPVLASCAEMVQNPTVEDAV